VEVCKDSIVISQISLLAHCPEDIGRNFTKFSTHVGNNKQNKMYEFGKNCCCHFFKKLEKFVKMLEIIKKKKKKKS
jgi:hypothetical protein